MPLYCLCGKKNRVRNVKQKDIKKVLLQERMKQIKTGAKQVFKDGGKEYEHNTRNVDVFECPYCGALIAKE
jgi:hypothetical protein